MSGVWSMCGVFICLVWNVMWDVCGLGCVRFGGECMV